MGDRGLIAEIREDNSVEYEKNNHAAISAFDAETCIETDGDKIPKRMIEDSSNTDIADNLKDFVLNHINYVFHEAVWIDGTCYYPYTRGLLIECETSEDYNRIGRSQVDIKDQEFEDFLDSFNNIIDFRRRYP
ncbi:MAG: hypothetical protein R6V35_01745 [Candidatus Nanohaloarchaea archaeon]